jgi:hypothetical protein
VESRISEHDNGNQHNNNSGNGGNGAGSGSQNNDTNLADDVRALRESLQIIRCENFLNQRLGSLENIPQRLVESLRSRFTGRIFEDVELQGAITETTNIVADLVEAGTLLNVGAAGSASAGNTEVDKVMSALDGFWADEDMNEVPRFTSFREAYIAITGDSLVTGHLREAKNLSRFTEALQTGSWPQILGDSITRRMLAEYRLPGLQDWRSIVSDITTIKDFRTNRRMRMGGYGLMPTVAQSGPYQPLTSPTDEESTYAIGKKGGLETITLEMIANDDVGSIRRIPVRLARAAANTLYRTIFDLVKDNPVTTYDAVAIYHASHNNLGSAALDAASLLAGKIAMGQQLAYNQVLEVMGLVPKFLLIPLNLEDIALKLTSSKTLIGATNQAATEPNIHAKYGLRYIMVPYWTDVNDWALVCDPKDCPTIEVGFYQGNEEPEIWVQNNPSVGSMFDTDEITYKLRHIYGVCVLDHRGMYKAVVA